MILPYRGAFPEIDPTAWIAPGAVVIGNTAIGAESSIWFGTVVRGDVNTIRIGAKSNIQDGAICHVTIARAPLVVEDLVTVAHAVVIHGCRLERGCMVGIGARVLDHAVIGSGSIVAAGSVVLEKTVIPSGELWAGVPARKKRDLDPAEIRQLIDTAERYVKYRLHFTGADAAISESWLPPEER